MDLFSGIYQYNPIVIIFKENFILSSIQYLLSIGIPIYVLEKTGIHEKKVNFGIGIALIISGLGADYILVSS
ncbi:hypothetical protein [Bacillus timonensis]|uniref:hypothetical protein n=1 Tax=Bacillus timonensis TaxID=1033734 RepID=UPI000289654C|nr:hypothetical protein [Bacillus timonensis]